MAETTPVGDTLMPPEAPGGADVVAKVTGPVLPVVVSLSLKVALPSVVAAFEKGAVWVSVTGVTVKV